MRPYAATFSCQAVEFLHVAHPRLRAALSPASLPYLTLGRLQEVERSVTLLYELNRLDFHWKVELPGLFADFKLYLGITVRSLLGLLSSPQELRNAAAPRSKTELSAAEEDKHYETKKQSRGGEDKHNKQSREGVTRTLSAASPSKVSLLSPSTPSKGTAGNATHGQRTLTTSRAKTPASQKVSPKVLSSFFRTPRTTKPGAVPKSHFEEKGHSSQVIDSLPLANDDNHKPPAMFSKQVEFQVWVCVRAALLLYQQLTAAVATNFDSDVSNLLMFGKQMKESQSLSGSTAVQSMYLPRSGLGGHAHGDSSSSSSTSISVLFDFSGHCADLLKTLDKNEAAAGKGADEKQNMKEASEGLLRWAQRLEPMSASSEPQRRSVIGICLEISLDLLVRHVTYFLARHCHQYYPEGPESMQKKKQAQNDFTNSPGRSSTAIAETPETLLSNFKQLLEDLEQKLERYMHTAPKDQSSRFPSPLVQKFKKWIPDILDRYVNAYLGGKKTSQIPYHQQQ
mmetsp:Transcript_19242/g.38066  ORF Transcript_19242/g.38066 Transcript_19242/m.38066 type:complete len:510 (-) Transcript_19242:212-1741(-)